MATAKKTAKDYKKIIKQSVAVDSSAASDLEYDTKKKILTVKFKNGRTYEYANITPALHDEIIHAPSIGRYLNRLVVKNPTAYPFKELL